MTIPQISDVNRFVEAQTHGSAVAFIDSHAPSSPAILKQLNLLASSTLLDYSFGFVDAAAVGNQELCRQQDVCVFPIVKFYLPDGKATQDYWIGAEQITENASTSNFSQDWLDG